ncbi:hypothetical protein jhhlp_005275 [Lomentospora prolificans]|uniref:Glycosyltransferase family 71 protein n=1 Tax=Lomentospora prolificans TaxID=41688 RepID=A0A2N3N7B7_9PEZI|nr:hypothetical protein jhhlp_005275 [Lomentospora prolificans]
MGGHTNRWPVLFSIATRRPAFLLVLATLTLTFLAGRRIYLQDAPVAPTFHQADSTAPAPTAPAPTLPQVTSAPEPTAVEIQDATLPLLVDNIEHTALYYDRFRLSEPGKESFGERGQRAIAIRKWIELADTLSEGDERERIEKSVEVAIAATFPFLANPPNGSLSPFKTLRESYITDSTEQRSRGIVIPMGKKNLRLACQVIASITRVHKSRLPIELAYAGEKDLPREDREHIKNLFPDEDVSFLDVLSVFNDSTLDLANGGWAIKPFALLASRFGEVLLADADTVFVKDPEVVFRQQAYKRTGALMFHDRLIDKERYMARHEWWRQQVVHPSKEVHKSLSWTENYAEEADSGVVVVDKSRLDVLIGMLHAAWQNSKKVRDEVTYTVMYGDKESYWFGLELTEGPYEFERYYGGIAGWLGTQDGPAEVDEPQVCSYVIAHPDAEGKGLLWYNGSLLKNKINAAGEYLVPSHWMVNGTWNKGIRPKFSCMKDGDFHEISSDQKEVLEQSVDEAKKLDIMFDEIEGRNKEYEAKKKMDEDKHRVLGEKNKQEKDKAETTEKTKESEDKQGAGDGVPPV